MRRHGLLLVLALGALLAPLTGAVRAASTAIEVRGVVQDRSGAAVPGARVVLFDDQKRPVVSAVAKGDGSFQFTVDPAVRDCTLEVIFHGFATLVRSHVTAADLTQRMALVLESDKGSTALGSAASFSDDTQLKAGGLSDPSSGGGYSDSTSATRSELIRDYARRLPAQEVAGNIDLASASEGEIGRYASTLLQQQKFESATRAFERGVERYPKSKQLQLGLGTSLYGQGRYQGAVEAWLAAADLDPADPGPVLFLAKAAISAASLPDQARAEIVKRLEAVAAAEPGNAMAHYYYGMAVLKAPGEARDPKTAQAELTKAVSLEPGLADAHFELANLATEQHHDAEAIREYQEAIRLQPGFAAAHYRLGQAYQHAGDQSKAQAEFRLSEKLKLGAGKQE